MRRHATHQILAPWSVGAPVLDPGRLTSIRIEPVLRRRRAALAIDLHLEGDHGATVIPLVFADPSTVIERDRDPLIFPVGTPGDDAFAEALAAAVLPHLERAILSGDPIREHVVAVRASRAFDAARAAGCFAAAPLRESLALLAPYRYARRFARGRTVSVGASHAGGGWAVLRDVASVGVPGAARTAAESGWYGIPAEPSTRPEVVICDDAAPAGDAACVVRIVSDGVRAATYRQVVEIVDPLPVDVPISFDPAEGPVRRWIALERAPEAPARPVAPAPHAAVGGSAGRIAVVLGRPDALRCPAADSDEATAIVAALRAEGFDAMLCRAPDEVASVDLVHVLGTRDGARVRGIVEAARGADTPVVLQAHDDDPAAGGWWGAEVARHCFEYGDDEGDTLRYLAMLSRRAVTVGDARGDAPYAPAAAGGEAATIALREASVVVAASAEEADRLRARSGRTGPIAVVPPLAGASDAAPIGALVGSDPFALVHAPIGPAGNQLLVARAAAALRLPLVLAGPVADASYLERVREFGGPGLVVLAGEPSPGVAAGLCAAAAVVVDAAWLAEGGSRLAAAALTGARLAIASPRSFSIAGVAPRRFDPADVDAIARALGEAWDEAVRTPVRCSPETAAALAPSAVVRSLVTAYAAVAGAAK